MRTGILKTDHAPDDLIEAGGDCDVLFQTLPDGHGVRFTTWAVDRGAFPDGPDAARLGEATSNSRIGRQMAAFLNKERP